MKNPVVIIALVIVAIIVCICCCLASLSVYGTYQVNQIYSSVNSFEECAALGMPIQESYPARCVMPDGRTFTQVITSTPVPDDTTPPDSGSGSGTDYPY